MAVTETGHAAARQLDALYRSHGAGIYRYALAVLGNRADAEDVTQTTFLNAYRALEQGVRPRKPESWLLAIASNAIKGRFRQEQARPRQVELDDRIAGRTPVEEDGPTVGELLTALARIPPQQRQAIVLREFEGRSYAEIAEILEVTTSALETLLFRARRSLAEELTQHLTCSEAQLAISRAADGRLGRKERRRLREHLDECSDCAHFARIQARHRRALRGLALLPVPVSLGLFRGLEGSAAAAALPAAGAGVAAAGGGAAAAGGSAAAAGAGGGLFAGGLALKAAAVVTAASVAGGVAVTGASELDSRPRGKAPASPSLVQPGRSATAPGRSVDRGLVRGRDSAPGQARAGGGAAPGQLRGERGAQARSVTGRAAGAGGRGDLRRAASPPARGASGLGKASPQAPEALRSPKASAAKAKAKLRPRRAVPAGTGLATP